MLDHPCQQSRGCSRWDYACPDGDRASGRITLHPQAPKDLPWFWTITARGRKPSLEDRGYAVSREQAMADFKAQRIG